MEECVVRSWTDMLDVLAFLRDSGGGGYEWVWLDSISLFQDTGLDDLWSEVLIEKPARQRYGLDKQEYGINMFRLGNWVRHLVGAEMFNVGITAHPFEIDNPFEPDPDKVEPILMPFVQGKNMPDKICGYMNMVGYMRRVQDKQGRKRVVMSTEFTDKWYGKDQFHAFPDGKFWDPTIPKLLDAVHSTQPKRRRRAT